MKDNARRVAIAALCRWERDGKYINLELDAALDRSTLEGADRALAAAMIYGVVERKLTLDAEIERLSGRKIEKLDAETISALRVGLYQLIYMDKIPPHAAVNETVNAAPTCSRGLVNAVLRRSLREGCRLGLPEREKNEAEYLSRLHSIPEWIVSSWLGDYGDEAEGIASAANSHPPVTLRVNNLRTSTEELLNRFAAEGIEAERVGIAPDMIKLLSGKRITELYGYGEGLWFVEDPASRLCASALSAKPGECVIDVCAAPGGKSFSVAIDMENKGRLYSHDLHKNKIKLIRSGAERLGITIIEASERDASVTDTDSFGKFDRVLCDVPCSGLGVIAKKPDIRYKTEANVLRLPEIQYSILSASAKLVKPGGVLVYSTCTLRRGENDLVRERFLREAEDFEPYMPDDFPIPTNDGAVTLMPHKHGTDGFYIAGFKKRK